MKYVGRVLFYILWPLVWLYSPLTRRSRALIMYSGKVLVVKNWFGAGYWQLPGGGIKMGETPQDALVRELKEELNIEVQSIQSLHEDVIVVKQSGLLMRYHFLQVSLSENVSLEKNRELTDVAWVDVNDISGVATEVIQGLDLVNKG